MKCRALYRGDHCLVPQVWHAADPWTRLRGLLGRAPLADGQGLLIEPCGSVHTLGMRYALDLIFLDRGDRVVDIAANTPPWTFRAARRRARKTLELRAGSLARLKPELGEELLWRDH